MDPKPQVQPLLAGRPICPRCMHGHQVEVITDRANSPVEYHCGCGNYAVVGVPAKWPFMTPQKAEQQPDIGIPASVKPDDSGSSPMQVGESLKTKKEEQMAKCSYPGCEKGVWVKGLCHKHYKEEHGEYVPRYKGNGVVVPKKPKPPVTGIPATEQCQQAVQQGTPLFCIFLDPELLEALR